MNDQAKLQGAWKIIHAESDGSPVPPDQYDDVLIEITGDIGTETVGSNSMEVQFHLDEATVPKQIDSTYLGGSQQGFTSLGIYRLDLDKFRMCRTTSPGQARPETFETTAGSGLMMVEWQRLEE